MISLILIITLLYKFIITRPTSSMLLSYSVQPYTVSVPDFNDMLPPDVAVHESVAHWFILGMQSGVHDTVRETNEPHASYVQMKPHTLDISSSHCEVGDCREEVFAACHRCSIFMCYDHFEEEYDACEGHHPVHCRMRKFPCQMNVQFRVTTASAI